MNKQRSQNRHEYQLQGIGRGQGLSPFQRNEPQRMVIMGPLQHAVPHVGGYIQTTPGQSATKVLNTGKRNELLKSKENRPLMGPYDSTMPCQPRKAIISRNANYAGRLFR